MSIQYIFYTFAHMKAKQIIMTFLCGLTTQLQAAAVDNGYRPMLADGKVWNYTYHAQDGDQKMAIEVKGDTVINSNSCNKLYLCLPDSRQLYGCFYEGPDGSVRAYLTLDIQKKDGRLVMESLETATSDRQLYCFIPSGVSWTSAFGNSLYVYTVSDIVIGRSSRYSQGFAHYPYPISPGSYELVGIGDDRFARVLITDFSKHDTLETWISGVGERRWGIMQPIQGVGKDDGGEWVEFESCDEDGHPLFTKTDFDAEALQQEYRPFVEDNKTWTCSTNPYGADIYYYHLQGDTLIDDQRCLKLYSQNRYNDGTTRYEGALYEKDKQVYWYRPSSSDQSLLYDFSLKQGEEAMLRRLQLPNRPEETASSGVCAVSDAYELHQDQLLRMILFYEVDRYGEGETEYNSRLGCWIEGVGPSCMMDVLDNTGFNNVDGRYGKGIIDCSVNGKSIYRVDDYEHLMASSSIMPLPHNVNKPSSILYDLQGRRLTGKPAKGLYIQNGEKRVVR